MNSLTLKIIYGVFVVITILIRMPHERRNKKNKIVKDKKTKQEKVLLALVSLGMMILPLIFIFTNAFSFAGYQLPLWGHLVGVVTAVLSLWIFYHSHKDLGENWSVTLEVREGHTLVTSGIYKNIRHPMYTAIWLWVIAQALLLNNFIAGLSGILFFGLLYFIRVGKEEQMMEKEFGAEYLDYKKKTNRLFPKF